MTRINYNQAIGTQFKLEIPDFKEVNYFVQTTELPGMTMSGVDTPYDNHATNMPSNRIEYDPLNFTFLVDEDFENYNRMRLWMHEIVKTEPVVKALKNITLHVLDGNKKPIRGIRFFGAYPTMISAIPLESSNSDAVPVVCNGTIRYQFFDMVNYEAERN